VADATTTSPTRVLFTFATERPKPKFTAWVHRILKEERGIVISSRPLEAT
jgi:hypothetical protein